MMKASDIPAVERNSKVVVLAATVAVHFRAFHRPWVRRLQRAGYRVVGVASDIEACGVCRATFDEVVDVPFSRSIRSVRQVLQAGRRMADLVDRVHPRLVHFHTPNAAFFGRLGLRQVARRGAVKVVYTAHGFHFFKGGDRLRNRIFRMAEQFGAMRTDALLTINAEDAAAAAQFALNPGGFSRMIHGVGLDIGRFDPARCAVEAQRAKLRGALGLPDGARILAMIAEFNPGKRHRDLVTALARCRDRTVQVALVGTGPGVERVRALAASLGVAERVHFLGYRNDVPDLLGAVDGVALPSEREGLPTCVMEAMAMAKPVIGANARGTRDLLLPDCGWVHETGDVAGLAAAIDELFAAPAEAEARGQRGRQRILSQYTWAAVEAELCEVYQRLGLPVADPSLKPL